MTSEPPGPADAPPRQAYVWVWLPGRTQPVVAGQLLRNEGRIGFAYGRSYRALPDAIPLYRPELPLRSGLILPLNGLPMASAIRDASPDAWGRRVILARVSARKGAGLDGGDLDELTYLLQSGSDRTGALDFQTSASAYVARGGGTPSLEDLLASAEKVERNLPLHPDLDQALYHGSSIGGARPKALIQDGGRAYVAKFSSTTDPYNVVKGEFIAMRLAALAGLSVAPVRLARASGKDVLLVERFDRGRAADGWTRRAMVSALTILGLDEIQARYASYQDLAEQIRFRFTRPADTLRELFQRLSFAILTGNLDDHARNHAAFWDGAHLTLTPAYDLCPQPRAGGEASQAMMIVDQNRSSQIATCLAAAPHFQLDTPTAIALIEAQIRIVGEHWRPVCDEAGLGEVDRTYFWGRQFLNPYAFYGLEGEGARLGTLATRYRDAVAPS